MNIDLNEITRVRLLVAITFHMSQSRITYLASVLRSLADFPVSELRVVIITNTLDPSNLHILSALGSEVLQKDSVFVRTSGELAHPFELAWCHKSLIRDEFLMASWGNPTHFIYLEDDMQLSFNNFAYYVTYSRILGPRRLIPSFLRTEFNADRGGFVNVDNVKPMRLKNEPAVQVGEYAFVNPRNPYTACFILDRELAAEYVETKSFQLKTSSDVCNWGVRERAAMGLCHEAIPNGFRCRLVVPVDRVKKRVPTGAWITHLPGNYSAKLVSDFARIRMEEIFM